MSVEKYLVQVGENQEIKNWINTTLRKYIKKNPISENQGEIEHILDYMKSPAAPTRLQKMSYVQAKAGAEKWVTSLQKKGRHLVDGVEDIKVVRTFRPSGMRLVKLISKAAYEREGTLMSHCVASYYGRNVDVYSLRDKDNAPHATIEVTRGENGQLNQIKGKGNGSIHPNYIKVVLAILKYFKLEVRDSEMSNLGYTKVDENMKKFITKHFTGARYYKDFFYNYSKLIEKK